MRLRGTWMMVLVALLAAGGREAAGAVSLDLEFNVDGVLPSSDPNFGLFNNTGSPESSLYSASGGFLHQRTFSAVGAAQYWDPKSLGYGAGFNAADDFALETRLQVLQVGGSPQGAGLDVTDGSYRYYLTFTSSGVSLLTLTGGYVSVPLDVFQPHTYRIVSPGSSPAVSLYIDGTLAASTTAPTVVSGTNYFSFGDGNSTAGIGADVDYDYIRVGAAAVPEPSSLALLAAGSAAVLVARRRAARARG